MRKILKTFGPCDVNTDAEPPTVTLLGPSTRSDKTPLVIRLETDDGWIDVDALTVADAIAKAKLRSEEQQP